jgi:hypothetical protein
MTHGLKSSSHKGFVTTSSYPDEAGSSSRFF